MEVVMIVYDERLLCLHDEEGRECITFTLDDGNYDPAVGHIDQILGNRYRVIRRAEVEPFEDGRRYWVVHGIKIADRRH